MKKFLIFAIRAISYVLIPIFVEGLTIGIIQLSPGTGSNFRDAGFAYGGIILSAILSLIPVSIILFLHPKPNASQLETNPSTKNTLTEVRTKSGRFKRDLKIVGLLILIGLFPLFVLFAFGMMMRSG